MEKDNSLPISVKNLDGLHQEECRIRSVACEIIRSEAECENNLKLIHNCMDMLMWLYCRHPKFKNDKETALAMLRARAFNSAASCLKLILAGYYQPAVSSLREILELSFLMDYFCLESGSIERWIANPDAEEFKPAPVRKALDHRDGFKDKKRAETYKLLCSYGTHPTYKSIVMMTNEEGLIMGPFSSARHVKALLIDLAINLPHMILSFIRFEENLTLGELKIKTEFFRSLSDWWENHFGVDPSKGQLNEIEEIIKAYGI